MTKGELTADHASELKWVEESRDGLREALTQTQKMLKQSTEENKDNPEFALAVKEYQANDAAHVAFLEKSLRRFLGNAGVLKVAPVAKKHKKGPCKAKGGWGGARKGAAFDAKRASSGIAERINMHLRALI
jgi:hypothetical protein